MLFILDSKSLECSGFLNRRSANPDGLSLFDQFFPKQTHENEESSSFAVKGRGIQGGPLLHSFNLTT